MSCVGEAGLFQTGEAYLIRSIKGMECCALCLNPFVTHSEIKHLKPFVKVVLLMSSISQLKSSLFISTTT